MARPEQFTTFKQSKNALIVNYVLYRWAIALMTMGVVAVLDFLNFKNTKLSFEPQFLVFVSGALTTHSKEIPYEDIKTVRVEQSIIGKFFNYGSILISMKELSDTITFRYVNDPDSVRKAIQAKYIKSDKVKLL
jgi:uncharacterized membrane protein YdbT with pleckstrin-like domain